MLKKLFVIAILGIGYIQDMSAMNGVDNFLGEVEAYSPRQIEEAAPSVSHRRKTLSRQTSLDDLEQVREAIKQNNYAQLAALLTQGKKVFVDENTYGKECIPALKTAVQLKRVEMVSLLLQYDTHVDWQDAEGKTYLHTLLDREIDGDCIAIFELLLDAHADPMLKNTNNASVIDLIIKKGAMAHPLRNSIAEKRSDLVSQFSVKNTKVPKINFQNISPRIIQLEQAAQPALREQDEKEVGTASSLGYFSLGVVGTIAAVKLYALLFKPKEQQKKSIK